MPFMVTFPFFNPRMALFMVRKFVTSNYDVFRNEYCLPGSAHAHTLIPSSKEDYPLLFHDKQVIAVTIPDCMLQGGVGDALAIPYTFVV